MRRKGISLGAAKSLEVRGCDAAGCRQSCGAWRGDGGWQPWPVCVRIKWKTTEQTEGLSTAPRRPAQQSLKPCYYSSPDGNLPAHLLFSSSRLFHNRKKKKKERDQSHLPQLPPRIPRQPLADSFPKEPHRATRSTGRAQPVPAAPLGVRRTLTAEGYVALTRWLLQRSVTLLEGAFRMGREKLGWRCGLGSLLFLLTPHKHVRVRREAMDQRQICRLCFHQ